MIRNFLYTGNQKTTRLKKFLFFTCVLFIFSTSAFSKHSNEDDYPGHQQQYREPTAEQNETYMIAKEAILYLIHHTRQLKAHYTKELHVYHEQQAYQRRRLQCFKQVAWGGTQLLLASVGSYVIRRDINPLSHLISRACGIAFYYHVDLKEALILSVAFLGIKNILQGYSHLVTNWMQGQGTPTR